MSLQLQDGGGFAGFIDEWGERIFKATFIYSILSLVVYVSMSASGYNPPPIVPPIIAKTYAKAISVWNQMSGSTISGSASSILYSILNSIQAAFMVLFGVLFNSAITFIWLGVMASELIPPPFTVFKMLTIIAASFAQMVLVLYLLKSVAVVIRNYLPV